jgi:hypothetical protein
MVGKIKAKLVLQLRIQKLSRGAIDSAYGISRHSIQAVLNAAEVDGRGWDDVAELSEAGVIDRIVHHGRSPIGRRSKCARVDAAEHPLINMLQHFRPRESRFRVLVGNLYYAPSLVAMV